MGYDKQYFASKVRGARAELNMTQEEFGKAIGVNKTTVVDYESGDGYTPGVDKLIAICDLSGKSPNELLGWRPRPRH